MLLNFNLKDHLDRQRNTYQPTEENAIVSDAIDILLDDICREKALKQTLENGSAEGIQLPEASHFAEKDIYEVEDIRSLAIKYRLRFLDSEKFSSGIPYEALTRIKQIERSTGQELVKFKILAPSEMFTLEDCDKDPLLFAELADGRFLFIHQWGGDLSVWRKVATWPLRNFRTLAATIFSISFLIALLLPTDLVLSGEVNSISAVKFAFFAWTFVCISAIVTYVGFAFFKSLSSSQWDSPFFKHSF
ncbi:hypothetical protein [Halocola ammonii]